MYSPEVTIDLHPTEVGLLLKCSPREKDDAKKIPGARARGMDWLLPLSWTSCLVARHVFGDRLLVLPAANEWASAYLRWAAHVDDARNLIRYSGLDARLKLHQESGSEWLSVVGRALLADQMRVGKTVQTVIAARKMDLAGLNPWPALCIVPNTTRKDWALAWKEWGGERAPTVAVVGGTPVQRRKAITSGADVVIASWDAIRTLSRLEKYGSVELSEKERTDGPLNEVPWRLIVADEVHRAADPHSKQTRAWWYLSHSAPYSWGLTGTPVKQNLADLQGIMYGIVPEEYAVRTTWFDMFCLTRHGEHNQFEVMGANPQTEHILHAVLHPRMERRLLETVAPDMPKALPQIIREVEMATVQATAYRQMKKHFMADIDGELLVAGSDLTVRTRLTQIAAGTPVLDEEGKVVALKKPSCKVEAMMDELSKSTTEPLVVFASSRLLIDLCAAELADKKIPFTAIVGGQSAEERDAAKEHFQAGRARVVLCTYGAGSEGIDLSRSDTVLRLQESDKMIENQQAPARILNINKTRSTQDILVLAEGTLEYDIHKVSGAGGVKEGYLQEVVRDHLRR